MSPPGWAVIGLGFGDEGKGTVVDFLVRRTGARLVARWNGGPQAAHHVVTPEGVTHCFAQFGSGMLVPGTETVLGPGMLVDPLALAREEAVLSSKGVARPFSRLTIDSRCRLVLPFHKLINQIRELARGDARHGSCGRGVGEAVGDTEHLGSAAVVIEDCLHRQTLEKKLAFLWRLKTDLAEQLAAEAPPSEAISQRLETLARLDLARLVQDLHALARGSGVRITRTLPRELKASGGGVVMEGAHGVLLDRRHGFHPHVTKTGTTFEGSSRLLGRRPFRIGVIRAYATRHGAGPLPTEDPALTSLLPEPHNVPNEWQGPMRAGWLDLVLLRRALKVCGGVDALAVTNLDRLSGVSPIRVAVAHEAPSRRSSDSNVRDFAGGLGAAGQSWRSLTPDPRTLRTRRLAGSRPVYRELAGWQDLSGVAKKDDLPEPVRQFLSFLSSDEGLGAPVVLISTGPSFQNKIVLENGILDDAS